MRRQGTLFVTLLATTAASVALAAPAYAATNTICVGTKDAAWTCSQTVATVEAAVVAAGSDAQDSTILIGKGTHTLTTTAAFIQAAVQEVRGSAEGTTTLTMADTPGGQDYVTNQGSALYDLTIQMVGGANSQSDRGLNNGGASATRITVNGPTTEGAIGVATANSSLKDSTVDMAQGGSGTRGVYGQGGNTITDTVIKGYHAFFMSANGTDTLSRVSIFASSRAVIQDVGTINIDDAVIVLTADNASGVVSANDNNNNQVKTTNANHLTVVGGGASSRGVWARAKFDGAQQHSTINLKNSIVRTNGGTDLYAEASNTLGAAMFSDATINVTYTDYLTKTSALGANGIGGVVGTTGNIDAAPVFVDVAADDYRLAIDSPGVDEGEPGNAVPTTDRDGNLRVFDGDNDGSARRDMGAYELIDIDPPDTQIVSGPNGPTNDSTPTFGFSSEAGATFQCKLDAGNFASCANPFTTGTLADGAHTLQVRAVDPAMNADGTPATRSFTVDTAAPETSVLTGPTGATADSTPTFTFGSEAGASFECQLDGAAYAACPSPYTPATLKDGAHSLSVRAKDAAGNLDATPVSRSFSVDTKAPETTLAKKVAKRTTKAKVKLTFSAEAGATFECQVDGRAWATCTSPYKVKLKLGKHTVLVRAKDALGNTDATPVKVKVKRLPKS